MSQALKKFSIKMKKIACCLAWSLSIFYVYGAGKFNPINRQHGKDGCRDNMIGPNLKRQHNRTSLHVNKTLYNSNTINLNNCIKYSQKVKSLRSILLGRYIRDTERDKLTNRSVKVNADDNNSKNVSKRYLHYKNILSEFGFTEDYTLKLQRSLDTNRGTKKYCLSQAYKDVEVYGFSLVAETMQSSTTAGSIGYENDVQFDDDSLDGNLVFDIESDIANTEPYYSEKDAISAALVYNGHFDDSSLQVENEEVKLMIYTADDNKAYLAYFVNYFVDSLVEDLRHDNYPQRPYVVLNAHDTTQILDTWNGLNTALKLTKISSAVVGNTDSGLQRKSMFLMKDTDTNKCIYRSPFSNTLYISVVDFVHRESDFHSINCDDSKSVNYDKVTHTKNGNVYESFSPRNSALSWGFKTAHLFRSVIGCFPHSKSLKIVVHKTGTHSYWDGSKVVLGNGRAGYFYPFTEPDIVAHEIAHAFTENYSNLKYTGQSGAINEAYSDMAGTALMDSINYKKEALFKIGFTTTENSDLPFLRDMCNPTAGEAGIDHANDWTSSTENHSGSGVYNKVFCLLSKKRGWSIQKAFRVFTRANYLEWNTMTNFSSGACGVEKAAVDLGYSKADVHLAFAAAGVTCAAA